MQPTTDKVVLFNDNHADNDDTRYKAARRRAEVLLGEKVSKRRGVDQVGIVGKSVTISRDRIEWMTLQELERFLTELERCGCHPAA